MRNRLGSDGGRGGPIGCAACLSDRGRPHDRGQPVESRRCGDGGVDANVLLKLWTENKSPVEALRESQLALYHHPEQIEGLATTRGAQFGEAVKIVEQKPKQSCSRRCAEESSDSTVGRVCALGGLAVNRGRPVTHNFSIDSDSSGITVAYESHFHRRGVGGTTTCELP